MPALCKLPTHRPIRCAWAAFPITLALALATAGPAAFAQESNPARASAKIPAAQTPRLRQLDFTPFESSMAALNSQRLAELNSLVLEASVRDLQDAMERGTVSSEELTLCFLARIRRCDEALRGYLELNPRCLDEARAADRSRREGKPHSTLLGIPLNVKDNIGTAAPMHTTVGAEILLNHVPSDDAALVKLLRAAGVVILGKASLSELAGSLTTNPPGHNAIGGMGVNPYGERLGVSGSSSGSAITVSACLAAVSVGTETSGSLISPCSLNGVVGMKPSRGLVSGEGIVPLIHFQDSAGPVARGVQDAAILLAAIDTAEVDYPAKLSANSLRGTAVGVLRHEIENSFPKGTSTPWLARIDAGLAKAGATSRDVTLGEKIQLLPVIFLGLAIETVDYIATTGAPIKTLADLQAYNAAKPERRIPRGQNIVDLAVPAIESILAKVGKEHSLQEIYEGVALEARDLAAKSLSKTFEEGKIEILVSLSNLHSSTYATAGFPAITVPLGLDENGTPNGVTFIGQPGRDAELLSFAYAFEQATRLRSIPPAAQK